MPLETLSREYTIRGVCPRDVYAVVTDYACYPRIFPDFSGCRVVAGQGNRQQVEFRARVVVEVRYVLDITHDPEKLTTSWKYVEGEVVSDSEGGWSFEGDETVTRIKYRAGVSVKAPLPRFVVNKISNALMGTSIPNMFKALEREALARKKYAKA